ncbi:MAG: immunoglobulin domain-containing protein [Phycisphaerae bacterium]|nr:immunoglobulin domain-containing protein [Phycisphaerae bacterium]
MSHSLAYRGRVLAVVAVTSSITAAQTGFVHWETPHISPITLTPNGQRLLAVNTADNRLEVFDASGALPVWIRSIPVGLDPVSVRARSNTEAWVVNHVSDSISIVDLPTGRVVRTLLVGDEPTDIVFAGSPQRAFVSHSQLNQVRVIDPASPLAPPTIISIQGEEPRAMAVSPDGARVYVAIHESGNATGVVRQQDVSNAAGPYGGRNPPPNSGNLIDPPPGPGLPPPPPVAQIVRRQPDGVWRDDNNRNWSQFVTWNLHDHDVAMIDTGTLTVSYANSMMTTVSGIGVRPDGTVAIVGTEAMNEVRFEPNLRGVFITARIGTFSPVSPEVVSFADLNPHLTYQTPTIPGGLRAQSIGDPRGIVWHPTSGRAYITGMGSNNVIISDSSGGRHGRIDVGAGPTGLAIRGDGSTLFVLNKFDGSISVISTDSESETARVAFYDPTPAAIKEGRPFLYNTHLTSGLGQASCASCHIDARSDFLAWDLGDPRGQLKQVDQDCRQPDCRPWHPMKGPMVTQVLQGIVGNGAMHWRGDRRDLAEFAAAFVNLQGADRQPSAEEMAKFERFIDSIDYGPNPNLQISGAFPANIATTGGGPGNPAQGLNIFNNAPVLGPNTRCVSCHTLPTGTSNEIDDPRLPLAPQGLKTVQLRGLWEKVGWLRNSQNNGKGIGFNHHSEFDTLNALLQVGFNFGPQPQQAAQARRDVEAFMLCMPTETHASIGQQITFTGPNNNDAAAVGRLNTFMSLADQGLVGLIAKGRVGGIDRGFAYSGPGVMASDRVGQSATVGALRTGAAPGAEVTFTVVPPGTQLRMGIDRDSDGYGDRDEIDSGSDPADPLSTPITVCRPRLVVQPADTSVDTGETLELMVTVTGTEPMVYQWFKDEQPLVTNGRITGADGPVLTISPADIGDYGAYSVTISNECGDSTSRAASVIVSPPCPADFNSDGGIDGADVDVFFDAWENGNPAADLTRDGGIDGADVDAFFSSWENGVC